MHQYHECCWFVSCGKCGTSNTGCVKCGAKCSKCKELLFPEIKTNPILENLNKIDTISFYKLPDPSVKTKLYYLIGPPRGSKTTFSRQWEKEKTTPDEKRVVLSGDSFRKGVHGQIYIGEAEFFVFACMDAATRALLNDGYTVLIDETSSTLNTIERYLRIDIDAQPIWINTDENTCILRAINLKQDYLVPAIRRVSQQINELKIDFDKKIEKIKQKILERKKIDFIPKVEPKGV